MRFIFTFRCNLANLFLLLAIALLRAIACKALTFKISLFPRGPKGDLTDEQITIDNKHVQNLFTYPLQ